MYNTIEIDMPKVSASGHILGNEKEVIKILPDTPSDWENENFLVLKINKDNDLLWGTDNNTVYDEATITTSGLMSAADKVKLDNINVAADGHVNIKDTTINGTLGVNQGLTVHNGLMVAFPYVNENGDIIYDQDDNIIYERYFEVSNGAVNIIPKIGLNVSNVKIDSTLTFGDTGRVIGKLIGDSAVFNTGVTANTALFNAGVTAMSAGDNNLALYVGGPLEANFDNGTKKFEVNSGVVKLTGIGIETPAAKIGSIIGTLPFGNGTSLVWSDSNTNGLVFTVNNNANTQAATSAAHIYFSLSDPAVTGASALFPANSSTLVNLGSPVSNNNRWNQIYSVNAVNTVSDRNLKKEIVPLTEQHLKFFNLLQPVSYQFIKGTSGRTHIGFISQDVEEAMAACGLTNLDFAGFCKDQKTTAIIKTKEEKQINEETGEEENIIVEYEEYVPVEGEYIYSLRYEEFIALNTQAIQYTLKKLEDTEEKLVNIEERLVALEAK